MTLQSKTYIYGKDIDDMSTDELKNVIRLLGEQLECTRKAAISSLRAFTSTQLPNGVRIGPL